ncbi:MAG: peptidylprolyl isomerase [Salinibacterium sp.]|nr:peptidylprolyl isomerase [Salinibacterium sp.]
MTIQSMRWRSGFAALCLFACSGFAQLTPDRLYVGVDRVIPMTASVPDALNGEVTISLHKAGSAEEISRAPAAEGELDLAGLFPSLWASGEPRRVVYAQLNVGDQPIGPAVVIQPLLSPATAVQPPNPRSAPEFVQGPNIFSGYRTYVDKYVRWKTSQGEILYRLRPDIAPNTAFNYRQLVEGGFYTDIIFHRIVGGTRSFVIQVGDPTGQGSGGPGYVIDLEQSTLPHDFGVLSMARTNDPNTNGSQVFVCLSREGTSFLDGRYTAFGEAISGAETIRAIAATPVDSSDRPNDPPVLISAELIDADPYGTGPEPLSTQARGDKEVR